MYKNIIFGRDNNKQKQTNYYILVTRKDKQQKRLLIYFLHFTGIPRIFLYILRIKNFKVSRKIKKKKQYKREKKSLKIINFEISLQYEKIQ